MKHTSYHTTDGVAPARNDSSARTYTRTRVLSAGDRRNTKNPTHRQQSAEGIFLDTGTCSVSGRVTNAPMSTPAGATATTPPPLPRCSTNRIASVMW